jgi:hypothetical protein
VAAGFGGEGSDGTTPPPLQAHIHIVLGYLEGGYPPVNVSEFSMLAVCIEFLPRNRPAVSID